MARKLPRGAPNNSFKPNPLRRFVQICRCMRSGEEGAAEFVTELTTGSISYSYMSGLVAGHEMEIETAFAADAGKTDLSGWLYNSTPEKPADLGYWVGYRIVKSHYQHAGDKRQALRDIFEMTNPDDFLARSGWRPGVALD